MDVCVHACACMHKCLCCVCAYMYAFNRYIQHSFVACGHCVGNIRLYSTHRTQDS